MDGKGYPDVDGVPASWMPRGASAWDVAYVVDGKQLAAETYTVSDADRTLTIRTQLTGTAPVDMVLTRRGQGRGLTGTWEGKLLPPQFDFELAPDGTDGVLYRIVPGFEVRARLDGSPSPMIGPLVWRPIMASFTRSGPRALRTVQKDGDKVTLDARIVPSTDGKTLTVSGTGEGGAERTWIFVRLK
jgi:hypothetical protein